MRMQVSYQGRVQGVGFRATARDLARRFDVAGWVRNQPDGTVLLEAQGRPDEVDRFLDALADRQRGLIHHEHRSPITPIPGQDPPSGTFQIERG